MGLCAPRLAQYRLNTTSLKSVLQRLELQTVERRDEGRTGFAYQLRLTPLDRVGAALQPITVVGRDLSLVGIGFEHSEPLPYRKARLTADDPRLIPLGLANLEIDVLLRWCRFVEAGRYESGGQILRSTAPGILG